MKKKTFLLFIFEQNAFLLRFSLSIFFQRICAIYTLLLQ